MPLPGGGHSPEEQAPKVTKPLPQTCSLQPFTPSAGQNKLAPCHKHTIRTGPATYKLWKAKRGTPRRGVKHKAHDVLVDKGRGKPGPKVRTAPAPACGRRQRGWMLAEARPLTWMVTMVITSTPTIITLLNVCFTLLERQRDVDRQCTDCTCYTDRHML